jgi:betaine-homocysteine S-methyltransferase
MLPLLAAVRAAVDVPVAALPVPYHTHDGEPTFQSLGGGAAFPVALDPFTSTRFDVAQFASRYSPDMSKHAYLGSDPSLQAENLAFAERL